MFIVLTDDRAYYARTIKQLNKKMGTLFDEKEFKVLGADRVVVVTEKDLAFLEDKRRLSQIPLNKLYQKDNSKVLIIIMFIVQLLTFIRIPSVSSITNSILPFLEKGM